MNGVSAVPAPTDAVSARGTGDPVQLRAELEQAHRRIEDLQRSERLQQALYEIADVSAGNLDTQDMLRRIHAIIGELMYAENCYIALYEGEQEKVRFLYFVDKYDPYVNDPDADIEVDEAENSLTLSLLRKGEPMLGPSRLLREQNGIPWDKDNGPDSADWLGVPMLRDGRVVGGIVVQSYERPSVYSDEDRALLAYVAQHLLAALDRHDAREQLEQRVEARTRELRQANLDLQAEVQERERGRRCSARCSGSRNCRWRT